MLYHSKKDNDNEYTDIDITCLHNNKHELLCSNDLLINININSTYR